MCPLVSTGRRGFFGRASLAGSSRSWLLAGRDAPLRTSPRGGPRWEGSSNLGGSSPEPSAARGRSGGGVPLQASVTFRSVPHHAGQRVQIDGLDHVGAEAGLGRAAAVGVLAVAGESDDARPL